jgi:CBS domain-containing protein
MPQRRISLVIGKQNIYTTSPQSTVFDTARRLKEIGLGTAMVVKNGLLVGILSERDVVYRVVAAGRNPKTTTLAEVMTRDPQTITPDKPFGHALHMMFEGGFRHVPVVDHGVPIGMVSARDALGLEMAEFEHDLLERDHIAEALG